MTQRAPRIATPPGHLRLNVDAGGGEVRVVILERASRPVAESRPIRGDQLDAPAAFDRPLPAPGEAIALKFVMRECKLYSYWFARRKAQP